MCVLSFWFRTFGGAHDFQTTKIFVRCTAYGSGYIADYVYSCVFLEFLYLNLWFAGFSLLPMAKDIPIELNRQYAIVPLAVCVYLWKAVPTEIYCETLRTGYQELLS